MILIAYSVGGLPNCRATAIKGIDRRLGRCGGTGLLLDLLHHVEQHLGRAQIGAGRARFPTGLSESAGPPAVCRSRSCNLALSRTPVLLECGWLMPPLVAARLLPHITDECDIVN